MGKNSVLEPLLYFNVPYRNVCQSNRLIGTVLSIFENLRSKGWRPGLPHDQIWAKLQFWIHKLIQCTSWHFFAMEKTTGTVLSISENLRVKSKGHQMTRCGQKCSFGAIILIFKYQVEILSIENTYWSSVGHSWKFEVQMSKVKVTI